MKKKLSPLAYSRQPKMAVELKVPLKSKEDLSLAYTPGIAAVAKLTAKNPAATFRYTFRRNNLAVISEGSAVLGLGNIGHFGAYPVMEGKAMLFKKFANIDAIPLVVKTQDPDEFIRVVENIADSFAAINLEDIAAPNCFYIEEKLKKKLSIPVMHDDQHGTATVVLAAVLNALTLFPKKGKKTRIVIVGAGAAGLAIAELLLHYGFKNLILVDSRGIISSKRPDLNFYKKRLSKITNPENICCSLPDALKGADIFIGVSRAGVLKPEWIGLMNSQPLVIAMANPVPEIMPEEAKKAGAALVATGRSDFPNQVNNALAFPGIFRAAIDYRKQINEKMLLAAAKAIVNYHRSRLSSSNLMPSILDPRVHQVIARAVGKVCS
ncbi:NADP-dependent malic enzyme [bacterium]|nr:NADP-dependent malic enzyme [bacterium]